MKHTYLKHTNCEERSCPFCQGGLLYCTTCGGGEITLPSECPGRHLTDIEEGLIQSKELDFINGEWIEL